MINSDVNLTIFCLVDDFILELFKNNPQLQSSKNKRGFKRGLSDSEIITICILFQFSGFRNFKNFYTFLSLNFKKDFNGLVSYERFLTLKKEIAPLLFVFVKSLMSSCTGISFCDSTSLAVCKNKRIRRNKVFKNLAKRGKTSMGWFFGFKLHLIINHKGEFLDFTFSQGNVDDRKPIPDLCRNLFGKLYGDRGYISKKLFEDLFKKGVQIITNIKSNMKNRLIPLFDKLILRKRFVIETVFGILKEEFHLEHSRHRSKKNFIVNLLSCLVGAEQV